MDMVIQLDLELTDYTPPSPEFDGAGYEPSRDKERLTNQKEVIFALMKDGWWRTLRQIAEVTGFPEASISAQLRNYRKPKFGGHTVERKHIKNGLHEYKLILRGKV